jgi:D-alanyl-lipoteichoic acid acyltransferase DltB (MBOAT superfamily)
VIFNSYTFLLFLGFVLAIYWSTKSWWWRKAFLLVASYVFYAAWNPPFVVILWISTIVDWHVSKRIHASETASRKKLWLMVSLLVNLGLLAYFKYGGFMVENLNSLLAALGVSHQFGKSSIILPVGISFYTFQTLSYTIDVYRGSLRPWHSALDYALYVTFFPQLVAGPIVRATEFLPQCEEEKAGTPEKIGWGLSLLVIGLFCKVVVADNFMAPVADQVYGTNEPVGFFAAWAGTLAFSVQIFCDFYGYSICAVGIALCLGFSLPDNFRWPYASVGFSDFWRRWHISLSSWLRDYLYIPLGGNRKGVARTYINLALTMLLGGLWHGASWMFVAWGALHGSYLIGERLISQTRLAKHPLCSTALFRLFLGGLTFFLVCLTWVFFRAESIHQAFALCRDMLSAGQLLQLAAKFGAPVREGTEFHQLWLGKSAYLLVLLCTTTLLTVHAVLRNSSTEGFFKRIPWFLRSFLLAAMLYMVAISMAGEDRAFIYFQF